MSEATFPGPVVARAPLQACLAPKTVALIGASERLGSVGRALFENLLSFPGRLVPVNPLRSSILGTPAYASIGAVPRPVDLAVIATPAKTVPQIISECAHAGVQGVVVISAGFKECGPAGLALENEIRSRRGPMRVFGPNCLGLMLPALGLNATFAAQTALPGKVAFLSQSGALCTAILDWSLREKVGFSVFASLGSMLDVGWGDLITHFGEDPGTQSIVCYMESVGEAASFLAAARAVTPRKPVIVIKVGRTPEAARAAASHTGALTGHDAVLDAAFRRAGVLRVDTIEELFDMAEVLAKQPLPRGPRLAIVTNAGGPGALATDMLVSSGGELASLSAQTVAELNDVLPVAWSHCNPIDLLGEAGPAQYARAVESSLRDPLVDGVLAVLTPQAMTDPNGTANRLALLAESARKPLLASWMGGILVEPARATLIAAGIPSFPYPDEAARAFALMWRREERLRLLQQAPGAREAGCDAYGGEVAGQIIGRVRAESRQLLDEVESKQVLNAYGIPTVVTLVAREVDEAITHAKHLGFPVVLKLHSQLITHKTDVGGVQLDLADEPAVRRAWGLIQRSVTEKAGAEAFSGVTVQRMIPAEGFELILGSSSDPQFGPVLLFGAGGEMVEVLGDTALDLPPLTPALARQLMERPRIFRALAGVRGRAAVDLPELERVLVAFSTLVCEQPWIAEIDLNPLLASPKGVIALDARILLHPATTAEAAWPRPALLPR